MAIVEKNKWVSLSDPWFEDESKAINKTLEKMGVPYYVVCSTRSEKGNKALKSLTWRRMGKSCDPDYPNVTYVGEKIVRARLLKDFGVTLTTVKNSPEEAIAKANGFWTGKKAKQEAKANKGKTRKEKPEVAKKERKERSNKAKEKTEGAVKKARVKKPTAAQAKAEAEAVAAIVKPVVSPAEVKEIKSVVTEAIMNAPHVSPAAAGNEVKAIVQESAALSEKDKIAMEAMREMEELKKQMMSWK